MIHKNLGQIRQVICPFFWRQKWFIIDMMAAGLN